MKKIFKIFTITLTAILLVAVSLINSFALTYFKIDGFTFYLTDDSFAVVSGYDNSSLDVEFPESLSTSYLIKIDDYAFLNNTEITSINFDESKYLANIGVHAFAGCTGLKSVSLPFSLDEIGFGVFQGCTSLEEVTFNNGITKIPVQAFYNCSSLDNVVIPQSVSTIENFAFANCTSLTSITIPKTTYSISSNAFLGCQNITIECYTDSYAHKYAVDNNIPFILLDAPKYEIGDVDLSGRVDVKDATLIQSYIASLTTLTDEQLAVADVNGDSTINVLDATAVQRSIVGI